MGIGAGIFLDGKLYRGAGGRAGEFGHITVDENAPLCSCGNNGCVETVASCAAIIQGVRTALGQGIDSKIRDLAAGEMDRISIELIAQAAAENDSLGFRVLQKAASYIAIDRGKNPRRPACALAHRHSLPGCAHLGRAIYAHRTAAHAKR